MKAVILSVGMCAAYVMIVSIAFRIARTNIRNAAFLTRLFLLTVPVAIAIYYLTPRDLGFLPDWMAGDRTLEVIFLVFVYGSVFFGGILQVYGLADRGFSLRISIDIDKSGGCMTVPEVIRGYAMGKGTQWMYQKRIDGLLTLKLIETDGDIIAVTAAGERVAAPLAYLRRFLRVEA